MEEDVDAPTGQPTPDSRPEAEFATSAELRIDAPEAGALAGLGKGRAAPSTPPAPPAEDQAVPDGRETETFELPNWADPPTGQVPRVLLERSDTEGLTSEFGRGPTWRQESEGFGEEEDLSFLIPDEGADESIAGRELTSERPFEFAFAGLGDAEAAPVSDEEDPAGDEAAWTSLFHEPATRSTGSPARRRHSARRQRRTLSPKKSPLAATLTGVVLGLVALGCFLLGSITTELLVLVATTIAAAELFAVLQGVGYRPATLVGLLAVPAIVLAAYLHGPIGIVDVAGIAFVLSGVWFLSKRSGDEPLVNVAATNLVVGWVGLAGGFAGLLLAPSLHPHRHGVALVVAVIVLVVADDIAAYAVGAKFGRHRLAPSISPGKTVEGLVAGTLFCLVVAAVVVARLHPFHLASALELGVLVSLLAPLGDLLESRVKRDLGVKDMGTLLPAHGGLFDRIDAMLFVLPPAFVLFSATHLG